nr:hypothetical protein [uncultured Draconibacterium sp.]
MAITIGNYSFEGPYTSTDNLQDNSGVYAIHCNVDSKYYLIDIGESAKVKSRIETHDRADCWEKNCNGQLTVSVLYTPNKQQPGRKEIEQELRKQYNPPCGER